MTKETNDGDDPVNADSDSVTVSRRQLMRALGAAGVTAGLGSSLTGSVAAQETTTSDSNTVDPDSPPEDYWMEQDYSDYVKQDNAERLFTLPSGREVAEMFLLQTPVLGQAAFAGGVMDRADGYSPGELFDAARGTVADVYYDPYNPTDVASGTVLQQAWYDIVEAHQLLERGITQWKSDMGENEELAHAEIELATRAAFNSDRTVSQAKTDARTAVRDLFSSSELNLLVLIEEILIRINGVFFRVAAELDNESLKDYWSFNSGASLTHDNFTLHQPSMHGARVELMDGRILETGVLQLIPEQDTQEMIVHPLYDTIQSDGRWEWVPTTADDKTYGIPPVNYAPPDFLSDSEYQLLSYNQNLADLASEMYNRLWELVRTFDAEIDAYVDTMYSSYADRGKIPMSELSNAAIRRELGMDWYQTGSTGFAIIEALRRGKRTNTEFHVDVEILSSGESQGEGERIDETIVMLGGDEGWTPGAAETVSYDLTSDTAVIDGTELHIKGQPFNGQHTVTYSDGSTETYQYGQVMTSGEWMQSSDAADWTASFYLRLDAEGYTLSDIESVTASVDEALRVGETYRIPDPREANEEIIVADYDSLWRSLTEPGEGIHIHSVVNAEGEEVDALHMRDGRQTELSSDGTEELIRRQVYTASERTQHRGKYDIPSGGGAGGDGGGSGLWMWGAAIGAGALGALGLQGGDDS